MMESQIIKGIGTIHVPTYKIHGLQRRRLKQQYSKLRSFSKSFSWNNQVDLDLGAEKDIEQEFLIEAQFDLDRIKSKLDEPYDGNPIETCTEGEHWYPVGMRKLIPEECMFCLQINNDIKS